MLCSAAQSQGEGTGSHVSELSKNSQPFNPPERAIRHTQLRCPLLESRKVRVNLFVFPGVSGMETSGLIDSKSDCLMGWGSGSVPIDITQISAEHSGSRG